MIKEELEPLKEVLGNYPVKVLNIRNETYKDKKGVWWVDTDQGLKVLKKISNSEETFKYIISTIKHMSQNGINFAAINKTKDGLDYNLIDNTCFVLLDAVNGNNPSYDKDVELAAIIKGLARFHKASAGFKVLEGTKPKVHLGTWVEDYTGQLLDMKAFYEREKTNIERNIIGNYILEEFPYFMSRASKAIESLKGSEYKEWVNNALKNGSLCHQDFAAGNLLLDKDGKLYVLDTDSITLDIPARDLRKILCKIMKRKGSWDLGLTGKIMGLYQKENPLTQSEWKVVMVDLFFPHLFLGAMNKYYYQRDKEWDLQKYFKRIKEMAAFEKTFEPVFNNFEKLIPTK